MRVVHKVLRSGIMGKKECQECKKEFYDLTKHMAKAHQLKYDYNYDCTICSVKFKSKFILQRHMQRRHGNKTTCSECGKKVSNLDIHIKKIHGLGQGQEPHCSPCGKSFSKLSDLSRHMEVCGLRSGGQSGPVEEVKAGAERVVGAGAEEEERGADKRVIEGDAGPGEGGSGGAVEAACDQLQGDQPGEVHPPIPPSQPPLEAVSQNFMDCDEAEEGGEARESCGVCGESCSDLEAHMTMCHVEEAVRSKEAPSHQCEVCGYTTNRLTNYTMHYKMVHLRSRTMCELCGKEYSNINQHMRVVHKALKSGMTEKHKCPHCAMEYYGKQAPLTRPAQHNPSDPNPCRPAAAPSESPQRSGGT